MPTLLVVAHPISFALQAYPSSMEQWTEVAQAAEAGGFEALCIADHPGSTCSPFVALGVAAAVTGTIRLGTTVVNGGVREPMDIASDVATLDVLSAGRAFLGLGAGHTPAEWHQIGKSYPTPNERIDRLEELLLTVPRLIAGDTVTFEGTHVHLHDAALAVSAGSRVPLLVGGSNRRLLRLAAEAAEMVEIGGMGRTLPDGHFHETRWSESDVDRAVGIISETAAVAGTHPTVGALVQHVEVTDDAEGVTTRFLGRAAGVIPSEALPSLEVALASPYMLVGTVREIIRKLGSIRDRWDITRFTVRSLEAVAEIIAALPSEMLPPA